MNMCDKTSVCCFLGHRKIVETEELKKRLCKTIERLIIKEGVTTFLFGSRSRFDDLCYELVTKIKEKYPHINRIYVRAEYPFINDSYRAELLKYCEDTFFPEKALGAGRSVYVERNQEMIRQSHFCVIYYDDAVTISRKSGTKIALKYARSQKKNCIIFP